MSKMYYIKVGYSEPTVIYKIELTKIAALQNATADDIDRKLDELGVRELVIDGGHPQFIERFRIKRVVHKLLRRKPPVA